MQDENTDRTLTSLYNLIIGLNFSDDVKLEILTINDAKDGVGYVDIMKLFRLKEYVKLSGIIDKNKPLGSWNVRSNYSNVKHKFIKAVQ